MEVVQTTQTFERELCHVQEIAESPNRIITLEDIFRAGALVHSETQYQIANNGHRPMTAYPARNIIGFEVEPDGSQVLLINQEIGFDLWLIRNNFGEGDFEAFQYCTKTQVEAKVYIPNAQKREILKTILNLKPHTQ